MPGREALGERERRRPAGVRRQQVVELGAEGVVGERLAPAALELVERRDQRLGDVAAAVLAEVAHRAPPRTNARTFSWSLIPGADSSCDAASTAHGWTARIAARTLCGPSRPASTRRPSPPRVPPVVGILALPRQVGDARDRLAVAEQDGVAAAHRALLALVELDEVRAALLRLADEDGDAQHRVGHREHGGRPARRSLGEDEAAEVGARLDRGVDVLLPRQPADLDERPREQLAQLRAGLGGAHQRRADEDGVCAGELGRGRLRARVDRALRDDDAVARRLRHELELRGAVDAEGAEIAGVDADHARRRDASRARAPPRRGPRRACRGRARPRRA